MLDELTGTGWAVLPYSTGTALQSGDWPGVAIVTARRTGYPVPPTFMRGEAVRVLMAHESGAEYATEYESLDAALAEYEYITSGFPLLNDA